MKGFILLALLSLISFQVCRASDDCLDVASGVNLVNSALSYSLPEPNTTDDILTLIQTLSTILTSYPSPYAINIGIGYPSNKYFSVQSCNVLSSPCFSISSGYYARVVLPSNGNQPYLYEVINNSINISNPFDYETTYYPTMRPWYTSNGWSPIYKYVNLPINGRTYEITQGSTNAHVMSDRVSYEPCNRCLTSAPALNAATYLTSSPQLANYRNLSTVAQVQNALTTLLTQYLIPMQVSGAISSMGPGYSNGDFYFVTDCSAYPGASGMAECSTAGYYGQVYNQRVFGSTAQVFAMNKTGSISATPRDLGVSFNTTSRPWYQLGQGWTDPYQYQLTGSSSVTARTYAAGFNGGVIDVDPNPTNVCPAAQYTCPTPSPSPCTRSSASTLPSFISILSTMIF